MSRSQAAAITSAIHILLSLENNDHLQRPRALFDLVAHIRWPEDAKVRQIALTTFISKYIADRFSEYPEMMTINISKAVDLNSIVLHSMSDQMQKFTLDILYSNERPYKLVADTVRFMINWKTNSGDRRNAASVKKSYYYIG